MELNGIQKTAFDKLFNAKHYNHYPNNDGWVTARSIDISRNTLNAMVKKGIVEHREDKTAWYPTNYHLYRVK